MIRTAKVLQELKKQNNNIKITIVTCYESNVWDEAVDIRKRLASTYDDVFNFDPLTKVRRAKTLRSLKVMIDKSDYFLCNLESSSSLSKSINRYLCRPHQIKVLDLGSMPHFEVHSL